MRSKYPSVKLFSDFSFSNADMLKSFCMHLNGVGFEPVPGLNIPTNTRVTIKLAHMLFTGTEQAE